MNIEEAKAYLESVMSDRFTDKTFEHYIRYMLAGDFAVEIATTIKGLDEQVSDLESGNENLHIENDTLFLRLENGMPWADLIRDGWRIVGMNHYHLNGVPHLFCSMAKDGRCITAESNNEALVFQELAAQARKVAESV
jgi:hypothetical protein